MIATELRRAARRRRSVGFGCEVGGGCFGGTVCTGGEPCPDDAGVGVGEAYCTSHAATNPCLPLGVCTLIHNPLSLVLPTFWLRLASSSSGCTLAPAVRVSILLSGLSIIAGALRTLSMSPAKVSFLFETTTTVGDPAAFC